MRSARALVAGLLRKRDVLLRSGTPQVVQVGFGHDEKADVGALKEHEAVAAVAGQVKVVGGVAPVFEDLIDSADRVFLVNLRRELIRAEEGVEGAGVV